ncbi:MAG: PH domain-containing protein [Pseudomonadota bacterium]
MTRAQGGAEAADNARHTDAKSFLVRGVSILSQLVIPLAIASFTILRDGDFLSLIWFVVPAIALVVGINFLFAYLQWSRLTYTVGEQDIRVDSGVLSRAARSVPFERIQDVSLEQKLLPRLFGLVEVKFETGAGGGEDLSLTYLSNEEGERLRRVVRERRDAQSGEVAGAGAAEAGEAEPTGDALFAMDQRRLFVFGMFEFSLAVFAVLAGLLQYVDTFIGIELWDPDLWQGWIESQSSWFSSFGFVAQAAGAVAGIVVLLLVGSATGMVRTFLREWEFLLEKTARGFRRRRGLLTKTDVVMPAHRVQALQIGTRLVRYRFGWHNLKFVSLAQDAGASNHVVAPFAKMDEIDPIVAAAGFHLPEAKADWHRASKKYRLDSAVIDAAIFSLVAIPVAIFAPPWALPIPLFLAVASAAIAVYSWQFHRHTIDGKQIMAQSGYFAPQMQLSRRVKLHTVEISRGPIAQRRGYATLHLGLAGGEFSIPGVPIERAIAVRKAVLESISATDFSKLESAES